MGLSSSQNLRSSDPDTADLPGSENSAGPSYISGHRKRKRSGECLEPNSSGHMSQDQGESPQQVLSRSHRKKVKIASEFAYQTLFLNGLDSDIKIHALGQVWYLHKVFLFQSGYFANMFKGSWKEFHGDVIELEINDKNIDITSLHFVFASLYRDKDVLINPLLVPRVLATACLLQVDYLIEQCNETMKEMINMKTVCAYYVAAETYGLDSVKTGCFEWLLHNLMIHPSVELYKEINPELMCRLVSSSNLLVMQKEIDIYTTLKEWMFLRLNPNWKGSMKQLLIGSNNWFSKHMKCVGNTAFLEKEEGEAFQPVFKKLRLQHIIYDLSSIRIIEHDQIIPAEWLSTICKQQWLLLLQAQQHSVIGPRVLNDTELEVYSMRCGKRIIRDGKYSWKWSSSNLGLPLRVIFTSHYILFKQNTSSQERDGSTCSQPIQNVAFRITLVYFDSIGKPTFSKTTGYKILSFQNGKEQIVMKLNNIVLRFPLYIFCNFLFISLDNTRK
uniref:germ cell-less protein-like 2 n=1 Tax=Jaculus jaculus TaxID=51337 RepID=UPI001E1AFC6D|nr:germ cell-less protein-like 2 [Jaculus jaculus]